MTEKQVQGRFLVRGRVQGVCYRMSCCEAAQSLGLTGWVRNVDDGSVEVLAEGPETAVAALARWCRTGPPGARVTDMADARQAATGRFAGFAIRHDRGA